MRRIRRSLVVRLIFLEPGLAKFEEEMKQWKQQDEDVLSYALFPKVATEFFKYREAQQTGVDPAVADTKKWCLSSLIFKRKVV